MYKRQGVIQPLTVKKEDDGKYTIISGERRWRASQLAGLETVPVYIREADDQHVLEMSIVENIQRQDLNAIEVALSLQRLVDECSLTQDSLGERIGVGCFPRSTFRARAGRLSLIHIL